MTDHLEKYRIALKEAAGDIDRFEAVFGELKSDRGVKSGDMKALALTATGIRARSKTDALQLLRMEHDAIVDSRARMLAIGGRTAA